MPKTKQEMAAATNSCTTFVAAELKVMDQSMRETLKKVFMHWFKFNPDVHALFWHQYTPYFNDGEQCEFSIGDIYKYTPNLELAKRIMTPEEILMCEPDGGSEDEIINLIMKDPQDQAGFEDQWSYEQDFRALIKPYEDYLKLFIGDHMIVCCTSDGTITTANFEHG